MKLLTERDRLAQRVVDLEKQIADLRGEARRNLGQTMFHEVKKPFSLDSNVRDHVVDELSPLFEPHLIAALKQCASSIRREDRYRSPSYHAAMADQRDVMVEVALPTLTTSFRVRENVTQLPGTKRASKADRTFPPILAQETIDQQASDAQMRGLKGWLRGLWEGYCYGSLTQV